MHFPGNKKRLPVNEFRNFLQVHIVKNLYSDQCRFYGIKFCPVYFCFIFIASWIRQ